MLKTAVRFAINNLTFLRLKELRSLNSGQHHWSEVSHTLHTHAWTGWAACLMCMQVVRYACGRIVRLPFCAGNTAAFFLQAPGLGSLLVAAAAVDSGEYRITVHALPRGSSPVHTGPYFTEYKLHSSSMQILHSLVARYWGSP